MTDARRLLRDVPPPRMDIARGFAVTAVREQLLERFAAEPHTERVDLGEHGAPLRVVRWQLDPAVAEVSAPEPVEIEGAVIRTPAGTMLVDSRLETALLRFAHGTRRLELEIEHGRVRLYAIEAALPAFEARVASGGEAISGWLADHVDVLRVSTDDVDRVAAAGALVRFFSPREADDAGAGAPQIVRGARAWARSIDGASWDRIEAEAIVRVTALDVMLDDGEPHTIALERDVLESARVAARLAGRGDALGEALRSLDRRARARLTALSERCATIDDPRLASVSWSEPEAWWGTLAR
jgi:hypothetical protein